MSKDYFGKDTSKLKDKKLFLLDMDGTFYNHNTLFEGSKELLETIRKNGGKYVFVTNNSSKSVIDYIKKMKTLGIETTDNDFYTSVQTTILLFKKMFPNKKIYCQGTKSLISELNKELIITEEVEDDVDVVLVGFDMELTYEKISKTCELLTRDIPYYATNPDLAYQNAFGLTPDCGSICQMIKNSTGKDPIYIGKPQATMIDIAIEKYGYTKEETVVIGDRFYTDIMSGINAGVDTICVLTGESTIESIKKEKNKPTYVLNSVKEIKDVIS